MAGPRALVVLALGLLLSTPALLAFAGGNQSVQGLATHMLMALGAAWIAVAVVGAVVTGYSGVAVRDEPNDQA